ncbi:MAG: lipopolysaccharide biosynthesis protein [Tsuneonella sp.]
MRRSYVRGIAAMGYAKVVVALVQLAIIPVLAVHWGLALYGQWLMIVTVPQFLAASDFGFGTVAANRIIGEVARGAPDEAQVTFSTALRMILLLTAGMAALVAVVVVLLPGSLLAVRGAMVADSTRLVLLLMMAYGLVAMQDYLFSGVLRAQDRQALSLVLRASTFLIEGVAALLVVLLGGGPLAAAVCYLGFRLVGVAVLVMVTKRLTPWLRLGLRGSDKERLRELWRPALAAMMLPLSSATYLQGSALAIGAAAGPAAVPLYTSLRTASRVAMQLTNMIVVPLMPEITAAYARHDGRRLARLGGLLMTANWLIAPALGGIIVVAGAPLLHIWTKGAIQPPQSMVTLVGGGRVFGILWNALSSMLLAINRHEAFSYALAAAALISVGVTYALVRQYGITGAAAAGLALDGFMFAVVAVSLRRQIGRLEFSRAALFAVIPAGWRPRTP